MNSTGQRRCATLPLLSGFQWMQMGSEVNIHIPRCTVRQGLLGNRKGTIKEGRWRRRWWNTSYLLGYSPVGWGGDVWEQSSKAAVDDSYHWGCVRLKTPWNRSHTPLDHHLHTAFSLNDHRNLPVPSPCPVIPTLTSFSSALLILWNPRWCRQEEVTQPYICRSKNPQQQSDILYCCN